MTSVELCLRLRVLSKFRQRSGPKCFLSEYSSELFRKNYRKKLQCPPASHPEVGKRYASYPRRKRYGPCLSLQSPLLLTLYTSSNAFLLEKGQIEGCLCVSDKYVVS